MEETTSVFWVDLGYSLCHTLVPDVRITVSVPDTTYKIDLTSVVVRLSNKHGDPYDKKIETTQACVTVICKHDMDVYDDHVKMNDPANMKCSSLCSDMPRSHVPRITIHDITVFREMVPLRIGGLCLRNNKCAVS